MNLNKKAFVDNEMSEVDSDLNEQQVSFDLADFSFETDGSVNVAFTNYDLASPVYIYKVRLNSSIELFETINFRM